MLQWPSRQPFHFLNHFKPSNVSSFTEKGLLTKYNVFYSMLSAAHVNLSGDCEEFLGWRVFHPMKRCLLMCHSLIFLQGHLVWRWSSCSSNLITCWAIFITPQLENTLHFEDAASLNKSQLTHEIHLVTVNKKYTNPVSIVKHCLYCVCENYLCGKY